jgi:ABC-type polysaccharide/polyol phosphate export permease
MNGSADITDVSGNRFPESIPGVVRTTGWRGSTAGLIWTLVRTDFKVRYHGTLGGFVWALLKPLTMFVMLMAVFSFVFGADPNYKLNLIIGLFLWDFFAEGTKAGLTSLHARGFLLTKARCPAWILVVTSISNALITLAIFIAIILVFLALTGHALSVGAMALFIAYCLALALIVVGFSLGTSVLFLRYRDLNQVWDVMLQAGFFVAPIIYPIGILPERFHIYLYLWAPTPVIQFVRAVLVSGPTPTLRADTYLATAVAFCLLAGTALYRKLGPRTAEYL